MCLDQESKSNCGEKRVGCESLLRGSCQDLLMDWIWVSEKRRSPDVLRFLVCVAYWMMVPLMEWEKLGVGRKQGLGVVLRGFGFRQVSSGMLVPQEDRSCRAGTPELHSA